MGGRVLVIFDGHCGLCNGSVRWFLVRDRRDRLRFVPSESPKVAEILRRHGVNMAADPAGPDTILVVRDPGGPTERLLERSDGVMAMLEELPRPWPAVAGALRWIPRWLEGFCLPADCAMALSHLGKAGKLPAADGRGAGKISLVPYLRCGDEVVRGAIARGSTALFLAF